MSVRPNVLLIQTDQQSCWTLGVYGGTVVGTPHIDSIGEGGAVLRQCFTNSALCTPSRGCFVTGRYPHAHGAFANNRRLGEDEVTLARLLQNAEYDTGYMGKWHLDGTPRPGWMEPERSQGYADCRYMFNRGHWKTIEDAPETGGGGSPVVGEGIGDERTYTTDWLTDKAIAFLQETRPKPFFLHLSYPDPHTPYSVREPYASMYDPDDMEVPSTFAASERPRGIGGESHTDVRGRWDARKLREAKAQYCGEVKCIDDNVGRLLAVLAERGLAENTIVVFTSDHGDYMGEHGLVHKNNLYETAYRIPMLIRWPVAIAPGTSVDRLIGLVDFQQTMAGLIGLTPSGREQGADVSPLLRGEAATAVAKEPWPDEVFLYHDTQRKIGLFTQRFQLVYVEDGDDILFDRLNDPLQLVNLFGRAELRAEVERMTASLIRHCERYASPELGWLREKLLKAHR
ncbi:sulfatase-like hydrolase/transferase [Paenibacillus koleovorans]|uniref:sulfatase-like hydrolase/transferase n=1 Tax=Paenibacillus koleovorans TaxID=121608 RepID=UPI000FDAACAB|nr:sulfatase-like hydrolase/transferase [Paenibacillus koleovorans]